MRGCVCVHTHYAKTCHLSSATAVTAGQCTILMQHARTCPFDSTPGFAAAKAQQQTWNAFCMPHIQAHSSCTQPLPACLRLAYSACSISALTGAHQPYRPGTHSHIISTEPHSGISSQLQTCHLSTNTTFKTAIKRKSRSQQGRPVCTQACMNHS
jgi:hypothetical protein